MKDWTLWVAFIGTMIGVCVVTVALAGAGEPQSAWLVCDLMGLEVCP